MTAKAQAQIRVTQITLNIVEKIKKHSEKVLRLDQCIYSNFSYESLRSHQTSHNNNKLSKNKTKEKINQTGLVPITNGVLISKARNSKKVIQKQNGGRWKNMYVKILKTPQKFF